MKRLFCMLLALVMVFTLGITTAFSAPEEESVSEAVADEPALEPEQDGADDTYTVTYVKGSGEDVTVPYTGDKPVMCLRVEDRTNGNYDFFDFDTVDGKPVLRAEWLETLEVREHSIWLKDTTERATYQNLGRLMLTITEEPGTEPGTEPVTEPATEPATEPGTEPATELGTEPATEPTTEPGGFPGGSGEPLAAAYTAGSGDLVLEGYTGALVDHIDCDGDYSGLADFYNNDAGKPVLKEAWLMERFSAGNASINLWVKDGPSDASPNQVMIVLTLTGPRDPDVTIAAGILAAGDADTRRLEAVSLLKRAVGITDAGTEPSTEPTFEPPGGSNNGDPYDFPEAELMVVVGEGRNVAAATAAAVPVVDLHTDIQEAYLEKARLGEYVVPNSLTVGGTTYTINNSADYSLPAPVSLDWEGDGTSYYVELATDPDFADARTYTATESSIDIYNLYNGTTYYWRYADTEDALAGSDVYTFTTTSDGPRCLYIDGMTNVRDIGGYELADGTGRVRQGLILRSGRLNVSISNEDKWRFAEDKAGPDFFYLTITEDGLDTLINELGVRTELDIRSSLSNEIGNMNDDRIPDLAYVCCSMEYAGGTGNNIVRTGEVNGQPFNNAESIKEIFELLADESNYPVIFHCNIGTDRTGCIAFLIEALCGVSEHDILIDYAYSAFGFQTANRGITTINNDYLATVNSYEGATLAERTRNALIDLCGLSAETLDRVVEIMVEYYE